MRKNVINTTIECPLSYTRNCKKIAYLRLNTETFRPKTFYCRFLVWPLLVSVWAERQHFPLIAQRHLAVWQWQPIVGTNGATTLSRMNLSGYVGHVTIF